MFSGLDNIPDKIKPYFSKCSNPLDETQVLANLFENINIRILVCKEIDDFEDEEYNTYYNIYDVVKQFNYDKKHISNLKINQITCEKLCPNFKLNFTNKKKENKTNYINEMDLKVVLSEINTKEAILFQDQITRQFTIMKKILKYICKLKHKQEQINNQEQIRIEKTAKAVKLFTPPIRTSGKIYIATSPEYSRQHMYKIGLTGGDLSKREKGLQTSHPSMKIIYDVDVKDVDLTEKLIHKFLAHVNVKKEFFYISSVSVAKKLIKNCCKYVNKLIDKYDNDYNLLRTNYIDNDTTITTQLLEKEDKTLIKKQVIYDFNNSNIYVNINNELGFHNLYHNNEEKQLIIYDLLNTELVDENKFINSLKYNSKTSKLVIKKYILSKLFKLKDEEITLDFLNEWLGKEYILDNVAYALGRKKIEKDTNDPYLNNMRQKIDYLNKILKVFRFASIFDFETVVEKDTKMETRMKKSKLLERVEYEKLMICFEKRQQMKKQEKFSLSKYIMISDMILNEFGVGLKSTRKQKQNNNNRVYIINYKLVETHKYVF